MILERKKRKPETEQDRSQRIEDQAQDRNDRAAAEEEALSAAVRRSIELHGP